MIKLGIIGSSKITDEFIYAVKASNRFEIISQYSRTAEKGQEFAKKHSIPNVFTDIKEMAKSGIDAIYIASPNKFHYSQSKYFLENNIHVICEKPITTNLDEYLELRQIALNNNVIYMEAIMSIYSPVYEKIHSMLKKIGPISNARLDFSQRSSKLDKFLSGIHQNIFDMSLHGGVLNDLGVYCIYAAVDLFGYPNKIISSANFFDNNCDKSGVSIFKYNDFDATLTYSKVGQSFAHSEIIGQNGTILIDSISQYNGIKLIIDNKIVEELPMISKENIMIGEANSFADFIELLNPIGYSKHHTICENVHRCMKEIRNINKIIYK